MDKWLSHPTSLKILSLVMGILLWAVVHFDSDSPPNTVASLTETQDIAAVKIKVVGLDDRKYALRLLEPTTVKLRVTGSRSDLLSASPDDYKVTVDVTGIAEGRTTLPVKVSLPNGIDYVRVEPQSVNVVLEQMLTKEYEVSIKTDGLPGKGYKTGTPIVKPNNRVHVTLPEDRMDSVSFVGARVSVEGEEETVTEKKVKLLVLDKNGKEMTDAIINPSVVEVEIPITKPFKKLPLQIGFTGKLPKGLAIASFEPGVEQVTVYGPQDVLDKYDFYDGINIDLSKLTQSGTIELDIKPEEGIATVDPATVTITYRIVNAESKLLSQLPVTIIGLSDGLKAKLTSPADGTVDLPVEGAANVLTGVSVKDVQLIADLSGLGPGNHVVPIDIHLPRFVAHSADIPLSITVEITDATAVSAPGESEPVEGTPSTETEGGSPTNGFPADPGGTNSTDEPSPEAGAGNEAGSHSSGSGAGG
ncbi:hypothetical protein K0T92_16230 [Paenibacillus oenotherae]|uniref:YbbR domain-containing protein n=1 Tax=Paenibacillus oenotherae TaxID=1435645 RepID=A0ABS7D8T1_9BACL|nr:CdaR family protein [Paenibacillus oenotherae]MBW7476281.1 hypothetical protein [Paenibacillus oenotherae]